MTQASPSPSPSPEEENQNIIWKTTSCAAENCTGWLVDSFFGKYWVKCLDQKHHIQNTKVEEGGKSEPSQFPDLNHKQIGSVTGNTNTGDDSCG